MADLRIKVTFVWSAIKQRSRLVYLHIDLSWYSDHTSSSCGPFGQPGR